MEFDILDALDDLGHPISSLSVTERKQRRKMPNEDNFACLRYAGILKTDEEIVEAIEIGTKSIEFTQLVEWLSKELQVLLNLESRINALTDTDDSSSFLLEVSSFLKELHCPYKSLLNGPISQRLLDAQSRRTLLDYLCTELLAARLLHSKKEDVKNAMEILVDDSSTALCLSSAMQTLNIDTDNVILNPFTCFAEIENKAKELLDTEDISPPIIKETLSEEQWESLSSLYEEFYSDYTVRRGLLLTRIDVTVQSFKWGEDSKGKEKKILDAYLPLRKRLKDKPDVKLSDIISARESLLIVEKTSSVNLVKNTKSAVNKILIPPVPDRGGRPKEQRPPVEMPSWAKRSQGGGRGDYRGGGSPQAKRPKFRGGRGDRGKKKGTFDASGSY